jgi:rubredoxin
MTDILNLSYMGSIIQAVCPCGLKSKEIMQGIGFNYPELKKQIEPAYCDSCSIVIGRDISKLYCKCPTCRIKVVFYKPEINEREVDISEYSFVSDSYLQERDKWHCPNCKRETLQFEFRGCWD